MTWTQQPENDNAWTGVESEDNTWSTLPYFLVGRPIGLLLALTYHFDTPPTDIWTDVESEDNIWT